MSQLDQRVFSFTIADSATSSEVVDIGRSYRQVYLETPSPLSGNVTIKAARSKEGTAVGIYKSAAASVIASAASASMVDMVDYGHSRFMQLTVDSAPSGAAVFYLVCTE